MDNRFFEMNDHLCGRSGKPKRIGAKRNGNGNGHTSIAQSAWSKSLAAPDRALVILIENGGVDLGLPALVQKLLAAVPRGDMIPDSARKRLVDFLREKIKSLTDNLLETAELSINRYAAAKPDLYGDVVVLRNSTATHQDLKNKLIALSRAQKIIDVIILTHGSDDHISVAGGVNSAQISAMKTEHGKPLSIRSVYMMNCVGSSLNKAWLDAGAKISSGAMKNNYLPEPTTFFFWNSWKEGQPFETAATSAYRKTINLMNEVVRGFINALPIPGAGGLAESIDFANFEFVKDSAPVVQGQHGLTISSDDLTFAQSVVSGLATTVLSERALQLFDYSRAASNPQPRTLSPQGVDLIKGFEGFRARLYNDPVGHCTVGYGTLVHKGNCNSGASEQPYLNGITQERATELLGQSAVGFQKTVNAQVTVPLNQNQFDALVSFVYNVGPDNFQKSTLLKLLNQSRYDAVPTELRKWTKGRQNGQLVDLPGLVRRRSAEADLFQRPAAATAQSFSTPATPLDRGYEFWAVWCENERALLPEIFLNERGAHEAARRHVENTTHNASAMAVRMGDHMNVGPAAANPVSIPASISYGQTTYMPATNIQVIHGPVDFVLPDLSSYMGNVGCNVTPPPPVGTQTPVGELSITCSCVNQSGTAVEMVCTLVRQGTSEQRSQILPGHFNGEFEFVFPNVARNNTYGIMMRLTTIDQTIRVSGRYTVMMTG